MNSLRCRKTILSVMKNYFIQFSFLVTLVLMVCQSSYATISLAEGEPPPAKKLAVKKKINHKIKQRKNKQYNIEGYVDSNYVRFVVELTDNNLIAGQMVRGDGHNVPVSGTLVNGVLHLYDLNGTHFTVVIPK